MTVYETTGVFNQQLSPSLARRAVGLVAFDPLLPGTDRRRTAEVIDFDPNPTNAKISGSRVVYRVRSDKTSDWALTVNLSTYFDPSESRLYALEVICSPDVLHSSRPTRSTGSSAPGGSDDHEHERVRLLLAEPVPVHQPVIDDREPPVRRKMFFFDRLKVLRAAGDLPRAVHLAAEDRHPVDDLGRGAPRSTACQVVGA